MVSKKQLDFGTSVPNCTNAQHRRIADAGNITICNSSAAKSDLLGQIAIAFQKEPSVARIFHGERRIHQGGRGRRTALFPSRKCGGSVPLESRLELAHAVLLERSPTVLEYRTQAIQIPLPGGRYAYPDFLIRTTDGNFEVHEVKPSIEHLVLADTQRFATIRTLLLNEGVGFRLVDNNSLPSGRALDELLFCYSRGHVQSYTRAQIDLAESALSGEHLASFSEAYKVLQEHDLPAQLADYLNFHQQWKFAPHDNSLCSRGGV